MNFRSMMLAGTCAAALVTGSNAMAWGTAYTDSAGFTHYNIGGRSGTSWRDSAGFTHFSGNLFRGGMAWTDSAGFTHYNVGGLSGTSWRDSAGFTHFSGNLFRGQLAKKLFSDDDFVKKADVTALQEAIMSRNVEAMTSCAWDLKGLELVLGKKDKTTTSDMVFASAAKLAVEQGNAAALKQIIALAPECKKFEEQLALKGKTRGISKSVTALPQLTLLPKKDWEKAMNELKPWEQPALGQYICASFRGMPKASADTASMLVNMGRMTMNPQMIAMGALELSKYPYDNKLGSKFDPAQIFAEAAELAIVKEDKDALNQIIALYSTASFKTDEYADFLRGELAMLGGNRGLKAVDSLSPMNFDKLIRTVYYEEMAIPAN